MTNADYQVNSSLDVLNFIVVQGRNFQDGSSIHSASDETLKMLDTLDPLQLAFTIDSVLDLLHTLQAVLVEKLGGPS